ncbi:MAG: nucleotidyltransferase family protein [Vicinamibacterales bacterium]
MKAFLLAGGRGERLRPLTLTTPKCLVPVNGEPLLGIWLAHLEREGVTEVLLNVSHHVDQVESFLAARVSQRMRVRLVVEQEPVGTAGTVRDQSWFVEDVDDFWVFYADNLTDVALAPMRRAHRQHGATLTLGLFRAPNPRAAGIVALDERGTIVDFEEKPAHPRSDLANAGIYLAHRDLIDVLPRTSEVLDFGHHVFPRLLGRMAGHVVDAFLMDVGTPEALTRAAAAWSRRPHTESPA